MIAGLIELALVVAFLQLTGQLSAFLLLRQLRPNESDGHTERTWHGNGLALAGALAFPVLGMVLQYAGWVRVYYLPLLALPWVAAVVFFRPGLLEFGRSILGTFSVRGGKAFHIATVIVLFPFLLVLSLTVQVPSLIADIWVYHIPIAENIALRHGMVLPLMTHQYYANLPAFNEFLFSMGLLLTSRHAVAGLINLAIFAAFLLWLLSFARGLVRLIAVVPLLAIMLTPELFGNATVPMVDTTYAVFGVASVILLLCHTELDDRGKFLAAGVLLGAALAVKYLALLVALFDGLILLLNWVRRGRKAGGRDVLWFSIGVLLVAGPWYLKNWIVLGNPIYPYVFGHPGLSDAWMRETMIEQTRAFDPKHRSFSRDAASLAGWTDMFRAIHTMFFNSSVPWIHVALIGTAALTRKRLLPLALFGLSVLNFVLWYFLIFNSARYGVTALLLFLAAFFFATVACIEQLYPLPRRLWLRLAAGTVLLLVCWQGILHVRRAFRILTHHFDSLIQVYRGKQTYSRFMSVTIPEYEMIRYITEHKLTNVFSPLDSGSAPTLKYLYDVPDPGQVFVPYSQMPASVADLPPFIKRHSIRYFVVFQRDFSPLEIDRFGQARYTLAKQVLDRLTKDSDLIYQDGRGNQLRRIRAAHGSSR